jgi:hypothetical protein
VLVHSPYTYPEVSGKGFAIGSKKEAFLAVSAQVTERFDNHPLMGQLYGAFSMCISMSDKPFDAEACDIDGQASATNGLSDMKTPSKTHRVINPLLGSIHLRFYVKFRT